MGELERNMRDDVGQPLGNVPSSDNRRQMDMFEDECQRASWRRHGAIARGVAKRGLVAFLAFAMAFGTTPAQLWAEGAEGIAEAVAQAATGGEGAAADDGTAADTGANSAAASAAADDAGADQGATASAANGADTAAGNATESENSAATPAASEQKNAVAAASATTLSSEAKVFIQDTKDKDSSYSTKSGALKAGETLWANMYDEVEDDWYGTSTESVANPGTWTYTWLAGTTRASSNVADYTEVVGHEQSLAVTAAMEGKYFICKVTVDGKDYYGPSVSSGSGINANYIPGPVLGAGQMELNSVKLNSDTPSIGDTLTATPYISYYQQAPADAKVTYTWSASTSQYSGFTKIEGETGASLVVGDDLEGKYIRVEANAGVNTVNKTTSSKVKQAGAVEISAVSIINTKDDTSVFAVGDTAKARAKEKGGAYGAFVDASKLNYQWQSSDTKSGTYTDIAGATGETLELTDALGGKYLKCKVSSKIGSSSMANNTGALVAATGSINVTSVTMSPTSGKVEVGSTITATAKAGSTDVTADSHVTWQWYKGTSNTASKCDTPIKGETGNTLTVTAALKGYCVVAKANGGYGEQKPYYAVGPVSVAGQVELYDVQFEGSPATNGVRVGDTLKTKVRKKDGSNYHYIDRTDNVTYQWQYANSSSSYDSAYTDIPGATETAYTVDAAYAGKYLRVKVTSEKTVSSTQKKSSYGGTQSVAPLGPVTLKGQYKLAGIELADKNVTLSVGSKITPSVQVPGSWSGSTKDVPDDAELTMAWYAKGEGDAEWTELSDGIDTTDGSLTISDALVGKRIKVTASALDNTVEWVSSDSVTAAGEYNLLRVTTTPQINSESTHLVSGDSVKATAQAKRADGSATNGIDVTDQATVAWYAADDAKAPAADWTLLPDMSGAEATVSASATGKYLKAVATSGGSTVELVSTNKVIAAGSLEAAVQKLNDANKQIAVDYSAKGGNVNDALKAQLADLGFTDIDVKVSEDGVAFKAEDAKATVGISDAQDKTNGDVTFFFIDPNDYTGYNIDGLRSADVAFELSRDGKTEYYLPNKSVQVAWDEAKLQDLLDSAAESLQIGYAAGESADGVTQNVTLPYKAGSAKKFSVEWTSSDTERLFVSGYSWEDKTGKVSRASSDRDVTLTAKVTVTSGDIKLAGSHDFTVTVKGDPEKVAADKKALQEKVDAAFTYGNIKYSGTDAPANKDGLTADLQMPRTSTLKIDGKYYEVKYSASTDDITFNGYKGTVYQPLPGTEAAKTKITLTVTDKSNAEVTASKTLDFAIAPQDQNELDAELFHLSLAKSTFSQGILDGQDASNVTGNLHAPLKVYGQGYAVNWCYSSEEAAGHYGFVFSELPGGTENTYRLLKSSKPRVIAHENLIFTQPEYNTKVTISGRLKSERFARYAERYPDNSDYAVLAGLDVSATVNVKGTTGLDNPNEGKTITVTAKVTGVSASDADGNYTEQSVAPLTELTLPADEDTTAESVLEQLMTAAGCTNLEANAWGLTSATMPDGRVLSTTSAAPYSYWSFFVNNGYASVGAPSYYLKNGDCVEFRYVKGDGTQKPSTAPATNPGTEHPDVDAAWNGFANGGSGSSTDALTPTTKTDTPSWALNLLTEEQQKAGASASASDPIVANGKVYLVTGASVWGGKTWNAVLNEIDPETGSVLRSLELGSSMDTTCRPVIAQGIILIPLSGGYLQAVSAKTFETLWYSDAFTKQNLSSLTVDGDYVYINTLDYWSGNGNDVQNGTVRRINIHTGAIAGSASVADGGYYWSGGLMVNGYYVVGGDYGQVRVYSADLSKLVGSIKLSGGNIRSALTVHDGYIYAVTRDDGTLHKLTIGSDGSITEAAKVQFAAYSTSTPVFSGKYAFIGGTTVNNWKAKAKAKAKAKGLLSIIDLSDMSVKQITKADGEELGFESKGTPLVSTHDGETYVYFTLNGAKGNWPNYTTGGGVYMYKLGDAEATEVFVPGSGYANYCMASVVCDQFGNLYYTNDSGHLFCVKSQAHRVKFDAQGGSSVNGQTPASGSTVSKPTDPTREGYTFAGWYTDEACTKAYDFSVAVTADMTLYAKWIKKAADNNGGSGGNGGSGSGNGTNGQQSGGAVSPGQKPVSTTTTTETKDDKDSKKDSDKSGKKDGKSDTGSSATTAAKKSAAAPAQESGFNPLAIVGVAAGVIGLAVIGVFVFTKRR
ncbi:InlB B-repeat-containing protein [Collinsella aerofaciens]|uniref:InlB B-repeat-containing protein n=2 Tax=Collinsella aerofaciens TaxID=74426 RepID=UPI00232C6A85|nr:InlB B-repeat-containing protein [Collinsella aerofaciens]MDB1821682.1 InlB B-repeat-containing protein [Collinsella aerofaciens]MDB1823617.1 InlB B-repeat-containing protein [Collinsella aerofaciens]MDB1825427.1 InlB B-repeat-containing protein [Collinsella aerofaciens]MDC0805683.1 InlB B-repeat-containing protein [Collinsella aerofaciens]